MSLRREMRWIKRLLGVFLATGFVALAASPASAQARDPWAAKAEWFSVRAGYAKSSAAGAPDGNLGLGFGYTRFRNTKWAWGVNATADVLGRFGSAYQIEIPWTVDVTRHFRWPAAVRPFIGVGAGIYYQQFTGTGDDGSSVQPGVYGVTGMNTPISDHGLLGVDVRMNVVDATRQDNPVFGGEVTAGERQSKVVHWGVKLNYAWVF